VVAGCGRSPTVPISRDNLALDIGSDTTVYLPTDTFTGVLTFTSTAEWRIREEFSDGGIYHVGFYDYRGELKRDYFPNAPQPCVTTFELDPLAARTETLSLPLSWPTDTLRDGEYRVVAWIEGHPDVNSETAILVNS
jgi:hypothetical protein